MPRSKPVDPETKARWAAADYRKEEEKPLPDKDARDLARMDQLMQKRMEGKPLTPKENDWVLKNLHLIKDKSQIEGRIEPYIKTRVRLAEVLGITQKTLRKYMESPNWPKRDTRGYDYQRCKEYLERLRSSRPTSENVKQGDPDKLGMQAGAAQALDRLEKAERQAAADLHEAQRVKCPESIALATNQWMIFLKQLVTYERAIDQDKRASGEVLDKSEVMKFMLMMGQALGYAEEAFLDRFAMLVTELENPRDAREIRQKSKGLFFSQVDQICDAACADNKFPMWLAEAVAEGMRPGVFRDPADN